MTNGASYHVGPAGGGPGASYDVSPASGGGFGNLASWGGIGAGLAGLFGGGGDDMSGAIGGASDIYQQYMQQALQELQQQQATGRKDITGYMDPYTQAGKAGLSQYMASLGLSGGAGQQAATTTFQKSPGYQFALQQGLQASQRGAAARGLAGSGAEQAELQRVGQGMANQEYGQWQSQLGQLAGRGQQAAQFAGGTLAQMGLGYGQTVAGLYGQMGQAQAEAQMAQAQAQAQQSSSESGGLGSLIGGLAGLF